MTPSPKVASSVRFRCHHLNIIEVEAVLEAPDVAPLRTDHDIVVRLVPEIVTEKWCFKILNTFYIVFKLVANFTA